jgi:hypothetical protein
MRRFALVDLSLRTDDAVAARGGLFLCKHDFDSFPVRAKRGPNRLTELYRLLN